MEERQTALQVFENETFGDVRTVTKDGEPWFVAADVCRALEIGNPAQAISRLDEDEKTNTIISNEGIRGNPTFTIISEAGLYALVLSSRKPEAKAFKRWITHDVIPTIRKHGMYATDELLDNPDLIIEAMERIKEQRRKINSLESTVAEQTQQLAECKPKATYYDMILNCKGLISISKIAKDYGMSAIKMNETLKELGVQYRQGDMWLLYQKHADKGYTQTRTYEYPSSDGTNHATVSTAWTQKGRAWLYDVLKNNGILPTVEREKNGKQ